VKYNAAEIDAVLKGMVEGALKLQKVHTRLGRKTKVSNNLVMKDPEAYELRNTLNNIHDDKV
jgi:hypothetical protein